MVRFSDFILLGLILLLAFFGPAYSYSRITRLAANWPRLTIWSSAAVVFLGCLIVAVILHEPVPRIHDEFSYLLMADTLSHGRAANPSPPLPEFFDTFHVLVKPVYASKYLPAQGVFLALGEKLSGHPAIGVWLSAALACAATIWMLTAWISPTWALLGGLLMALQYGIFSYWSQSYWGGMVAALGGALFFGAIRRLWDEFSWKCSGLLALGLVILADSRALEGFIVVVPAMLLFLYRLIRGRQWQVRQSWTQFVIPFSLVLAFGAFLTGAYNQAITGSALGNAYVLHEQQYQESPPLMFLPMRSPKTYSSPWVAYFYQVQERESYTDHPSLAALSRALSMKLRTWWAFYCGVLLSVPLFLPGILRRGTRWWQVGLLTVLVAVALTINRPIRGWPLLLDALAIAQIGLLWVVFDDFWSRLAIATCALMVLELFVVKWPFPHYFAPAAPLVLYLQIKGLHWLWHYQSDRSRATGDSERVSLQRWFTRTAYVQNLILLLPLACAISLVVHVAARREGWKDGALGPNRYFLLSRDWSLQRAQLENWLEQQPGSQLVFVRYSSRHNVGNEWVFNQADLLHSKVLWARDLGTEHNRLLLQRFPDRTPWLIEADDRPPRAIPYAQASGTPGLPPASSASATGGPERDPSD